LNFVEKLKSELGFKAAHRELVEEGGTYALREHSEAYGSNFTGKNLSTLRYGRKERTVSPVRRVLFTV
jgi:hypothetical protein